MPVNTINTSNLFATQSLSDTSFLEQLQNQNKPGNAELPPEKLPGQKNPLLQPDSAGEISPAALQNWAVAVPSPGAMLAALCVKDACQQNEENQKQLMSQAENVQKEYKAQADEIRKNAITQIVVGCVSAAISATLSGISAYKTSKVDSDLVGTNAEKALQGARNWATASKFTEQVINSGSTYANLNMQAETKKMDATIEQCKVMMEQLRTSQQAQRDLISKSLDFMNAMQSNINQTQAKILG